MGTSRLWEALLLDKENFFVIETAAIHTETSILEMRSTKVILDGIFDVWETPFFANPCLLVVLIVPGVSEIVRKPIKVHCF